MVLDCLANVSASLFDRSSIRETAWQSGAVRMVTLVLGLFLDDDLELIETHASLLHPYDIAIGKPVLPPPVTAHPYYPSTTADRSSASQANLHAYACAPVDAACSGGRGAIKGSASCPSVGSSLGFAGAAVEV